MNIFFGKNLKKLRLGRDLTQEKLADFIGVTFQAISKWERGEGYPDITTLPVISSFFGVTIDELLGVDQGRADDKIVSLLDKYDNLLDFTAKKELLDELIEFAPNDYRVLLRQMTYLIHSGVQSGTLDMNMKKINSIYENIQHCCTNDRIRICATRHMAYLYADLANQNDETVSFDDVEKILADMPYMRDGQEFIGSFLYPPENDRFYSKSWEAMEESFGLFIATVAHYSMLNEKYTADEKIEMLGKIIFMHDMLFDDGNYGVQWFWIVQYYLELSHLYFQKGDRENAIKSIKKGFSLAEKCDSLDKVTVMKSLLFEGREFNKDSIGIDYCATEHLRKRIAEFDDDFKAIANM